MQKNKIAGNLFFAFAAQFIAFLISAMTTLVMPKVLGTAEYGYWQMFTLYYGYAGFLLFGYNDGLYLHNGGKTDETVNRGIIKSHITLLTIYSVIIAVLIITIAPFIFAESERVFVVQCCAIYFLMFGVTHTLGYFLQATNKTRAYSLAQIINRLVFAVILLAALVFQIKEYKLLIISQLFAYLCSTVYILYSSKAVLSLRVPVVEWTNSFPVMIQYIKTGFKLMVGYYAGTLIISFGRMCVDWKWGIEAFSRFSLSFSIISIVLAFVGQVSMVLFPVLCSSTKERQADNFVQLQSILELFLPAIYILYVPMSKLIVVWLPQYEESILYLSLLLPICVFDGKWNMLLNTYLKVLKKENEILLINIASLAIAAVLCFISIFVLNSINCVALSIMLGLLARSIWAECFICRIYGSKGVSSIGAEVAFMLLFILANWLFPDNAFYLILFAYMIYLIFRRCEVRRVVKGFCIKS